MTRSKRNGPRPDRHRLRLREIHGHVTVTDDTLTAWFVLSQQRWSFTTEAQREALIHAYAQRLTELTGHRVHLRVTTRPYPAHEWARALHENTPHPLPGWGEHLTTAQKALRTAVLSDKVVYLGVEFTSKATYPRTFATLVGGKRGVRFSVEMAHQELSQLAEIVSGPGMGGRPARTDEVEWLMHRSVRLGLPAPVDFAAGSEEPWTPEDVHAFTDGVTYHWEGKFPGVIRIDADYQGKIISRYVAVLTVGRMSPLTIPQTSVDPWMQHTDRFDFPVEWTSTFDVLDGEAARKETAKKRLGIRDMQKQYRAHDLDEPLDLHRNGEHARRIEDETTSGSPLVASRCYGWHRLAVSATTEEECLRRARRVIKSYVGQQVTINHPRSLVDAAAQPDLLTEFIPGEPVSTQAYMRRLPVLYFAAGLPHVSASIGDGRGPFMGYTVGASKRAFNLDPHYAMEVAEASGLIPVVGGLGAGKSVIMGVAGRESAKRGILTTILDPSGPLANLTRMPDLVNHSRHIDLIDGEDGILSPYAVIRDPNPDNYDEEGWAAAVKLRGQSRKMLALDVARMLLPVQVDAMPLTPLVLGDAIRAVGTERTASLWDVIAHLDKDSRDHAAALANYLRDMADMPQARLFFPNTIRDVDPLASMDTLLVLTMHGLTLPAQDQDRKHWSTAEQLSVPLLHLGSHLTTARAYALDRNERKMVNLDEAGLMARWGSGRSLFSNLGRDSRKWNIAALVASQSPGDILGMNVANFISTAFVGRIEDEETAAEALRLLRIKPGNGYEEVLAGLSPQVALANGGKKRGPREFVVKDVHGNVEKVRIDRSHEPEVIEALNTTPEQYADRVSA